MTSKDPVIAERKRLYRTTRWRKIRLVILDRDPVCTICRKAPSNQVDHVVHDDNNSKFFDPSNLRGACALCNNRRGATERGKKAFIKMENRMTRAAAEHHNRVEQLMHQVRSKQQ